MLPQEFIQKIRESEEKILSLVEEYHPSSAKFRQSPPELAITAHDAQAACDVICKQVVKKEAGLASPVDRLKEALADNNASAAYSILSSTWFGVPETSSWRQFTGAIEVCDLLDDPPESEEPGDGEVG